MGSSMSWAAVWEGPVWAMQWLFQPVTAGKHTTYIHKKYSTYVHTVDILWIVIYINLLCAL